MINFRNNWIEMDCPNCKYSISIMLQSILLEELYYCHNCKKSIQLIDSNASLRLNTNMIEQEFNKLKKLFK
ncbi:MAG: hypothetical protein K0Q87_987 [Neobacillus sp.]|jgi:DNA-directed RNA polymerase subunit RPC12/RpoP|nr:hypothetical protein [Neobacillus sp.]